MVSFNETNAYPKNNGRILVKWNHFEKCKFWQKIKLAKKFVKLNYFEYNLFSQKNGKTAITTFYIEDAVFTKKIAYLKIIAIKIKANSKF